MPEKIILITQRNENLDGASRFKMLPLVTSPHFSLDLVTEVILLMIVLFRIYSCEMIRNQI